MNRSLLRGKLIIRFMQPSASGYDLFWPDIRGAHAPDERVEIESIARCGQLLQAVLLALAEPHIAAAGGQNPPSWI
ncbi:MAG: hypothetical protein Q8O64_16515 [Sideroxyarcus sp.]|nr:hypothetical protein [Sideroxyarcus sp.]